MTELTVSKPLRNRGKGPTFRRLFEAVRYRHQWCKLPYPLTPIFLLHLLSVEGIKELGGERFLATEPRYQLRAFRRLGKAARFKKINRYMRVT